MGNKNIGGAILDDLKALPKISFMGYAFQKIILRNSQR